jgi:hypothetical protein
MDSLPLRHQTALLARRVIGVGDVIGDAFSPLSTSSDDSPLSDAPSSKLLHQGEREKERERESIRKHPISERTGAEGHQERKRERVQASEREEAEGSGREREGEGEGEGAGSGGAGVDLGDGGVSASADADVSTGGSPNRNAAGILMFSIDFVSFFLKPPLSYQLRDRPTEIRQVCIYLKD